MPYDPRVSVLHENQCPQKNSTRNKSSNWKSPNAFLTEGINKQTVVYPYNRINYHSSSKKEQTTHICSNTGEFGNHDVK